MYPVNEGFPDGLHIIDLPQDRAGFRNFISSWFFTDSKGRKVLVDPGPTSTIPLLLKNIREITDTIDLVLLTHIHIDHSGGIGYLCKNFPKVRVLAHPNALKHLINPAKLWNSSLNALGDVAEMYGIPKPLDRHFIAAYDEFPDITIIETPGHSSHHIAFIVAADFGRLVFVGEAAGIYLSLFSNIPYIRPSSPSRFEGEAARNSLDKIIEFLKDNDFVCYAHWGLAKNPLNEISLAKKQLDFWLEAISGMNGSDEEAITEYLLAIDQLISSFSALPQDIKTRERMFIRNSVRGIIDYLKSRT
jgi:glyoxylase-like metal-dependent hydrolase (beta-lactamase superfamily II)